MRSLYSFGASKEMSLAVAGSGHRPEMLRRKTLGDNARLLLLACALAMPFAVFWLVGGQALPFVVAAIGLGIGMATLAFHASRQYEQAAAGQVFGILGTGLVLTLVDPQLADAGLAIALMAPVHASLLARSPMRKLSWLLLAGVLACAGVASFAGLGGAEVPATLLGVVSGLAFIVCAGMVAYTAHRIGAAFEVYDKAQVTAYQHLIEHVRDSVVRFSAEGDVLLASRSSETLFGCRRYELSGASLSERLHVLDRPIYLTAFSDANKAGKSRVVEVRMRQDDPVGGTKLPRYIWVEASFSPVREDLPTEGGYEVVALFRDITARKDNEAAMREAQRIAEEASTAKSRFLATIGHELRTPLNAVVGFSEMMTSGIGGELSPSHREYAGLIHQGARHLLEVVRMLLDMSKLEAGKFELQTEAFPAADMVQPCLQMVEGSARQRGIKIVADIAPKLPALVADERACRQILLNLLSNAIKFSHDGGTVTVSLKRQGQCLNLSVTDTGVGMAPEALDRLGEAFFQAHEGLARRYEGTGLGLSIVKGLVELHDGTLRALSEIGAGTTVTVLLPVNGPAIKVEDTPAVTPLHREPVSSPISSWQDEKRKAQ
ncbi:MAG: sensor histidine kinase [Devosia sp.]|jgi:cell cycle sensor histidine kinase DivJ|nr:sensor histidine kinase [Devosia sp.]